MVFDIIYWFTGGWSPFGEDFGMLLFDIIAYLFGIDTADYLFN